MTLTIRQVAGPGAAADEVYREVLAPSFPADELIGPQDFGHALSIGDFTVLAAYDDTGTPLGAAVGQWFADSRVMLLSYLAVAADGRGLGLGQILLRNALARWTKEHTPALVLAEVERPDRHAGTAAHGDPAARLRFYQRFDALALELPWFQPALGPTTGPVHGLLLVTLFIGTAGHGKAPATVDGRILAKFARSYLDGDGSPPAGRLLGAIRRHPAGIGLRPLQAYSGIPASTG